MKVLLVEHIHQAAENMLTQKAEIVFPEPQNTLGILAAIGDCEALICRNTKITRQIMEAAPKLRAIGKHGVGYDTVDISSANDLLIPVLYTPAANTESVAELAVGFIICSGRKIVEANRTMQSGKLISETVTMPIMAKRHGLVTADIWGKTLGIIGVGRIGSSVAKKMITAFNMRVLGYDPYVDEKTLAGYGVKKADTLEDMLPQCDFVSLNCPGGAETKHMINARTLALMKPSAYVINTARGTVVDETALLQAIQKEQIAGAATDVYDPEPPAPGSPIIRTDSIIVTPHLGAQTEESLYRMGTTIVQGILDVLESKRPEYLVNPAVWEKRKK
ncbi:MAG: hydroxyacid dehydrogenase [Thermodesulfobacteriota bacterium]